MKSFLWNTALAATFSILFMTYRQVWQEYTVFSKGVIRAAGVVNSSRYCANRNNRITVSLDNQEYQLSISRDECRNGVYRAGDTVMVRHYPGVKRILRPEADPRSFAKILLGITLIVIVFTTAHFYWKWKEKGDGKNEEGTAGKQRERFPHSKRR